MIKKNKVFDERVLKMVDKTIDEFNGLYSGDLVSLWSFFNFLIADKAEDYHLEKKDEDDRVLFVTGKKSIIYKNKDVLKKKYDINIVSLEDLEWKEWLKKKN